jgi:glycosyltransferase involved in cell wall biosynthesis
MLTQNNPTRIPSQCTICCLGYNHAQFLTDCIEAIWTQDYQNLQIVVVDDGSKDNSVVLLNELQARSPIPMTVIAQANTGNIGYNFNRAFQAATGEFVLFMSMDDKLYPHAISEKLALMNNDKNIAFIANSKVMSIDDNNNIKESKPALKLHKIENPTIEDLLNLEFEEFGSFYIQGTVFRSDVVTAVGAFDEDMVGDDIILRTRVFRHVQANPELTFKVFKTPACYYRMHDSNVHKNSYRQLKIVALYLEKYWPDQRSPKILKKWLRHAIKNSDTKTAFNAFFINDMTRQYLWHPRLWFIFARTTLKRSAYKMIGKQPKRK